MTLDLFNKQFLDEVILNAVQRDESSPVSGCCDRAFWSWKSRDFADLSLQYAIYPLSLGFSPQMRVKADAIRDMALFWAGNLSRAGSADQMFPGERSVGPTLYSLHGVLSAWPVLVELLSDKDIETLRRSVSRAFEFALAEPEAYGFVANHKALFAHAYLLGYRLLDDQKFYEACSSEVEGVKNHFQEGWFLEYETADPGYQTQCLHYLTLLQRDAPELDLKDTIRRGIEFCSWFVFPDRSFSGRFAGRATELFYPFAFFYWADEWPECRDIISFLYGADDPPNLVRWDCLDFANLVRLGTNYALCAPLLDRVGSTGTAKNLPCQSQATKRWPEAGLAALSLKNAYLVANLKRGGIFKLVERNTLERHEDDGYCVQAGGARYATSFFSGDRRPKFNESTLETTAPLLKIRDSQATPAIFVGLRLAAVFFKIFPYLNTVLKRCMVSMLITRKKCLPGTYSRKFEFHDSSILIEDGIEVGGGTKFAWDFASRTVPFHMACSGYYVKGNEVRVDGGNREQKNINESSRMTVRICTEIKLSELGISVQREIQ